MKCQREKFLLPRKIAYLNCAYMSPMMKKVENAGIKGIKGKRKPYRIQPDDFFRDTETIRLIFSELIEADDANRIVIVPSASYGLANVANNIQLESHHNIVVVGEQFPSNVYPWMDLTGRSGAALKIITPPEAFQNRGADWNKKILAAIDENTAMVALGHVHWADGTLFDLLSIRSRTKEVGAKLIIDGTQSVGALPFSVKEIQPDALICAGYKWLMGPYSIGLAYYGPAYDDGQPIEHNWINRLDSENFANLINYQEAFQPGALRYEVGEHSNFILVPMLLEAIKQIRRWGISNIQDYCKGLLEPYWPEIKSLGYLVEDSQYRSNHLFGIRLDRQHDMQKVQLALKKHRVSVSMRGSAIRISPHLYNDDRDVQRLLRSLRDGAS